MGTWTCSGGRGSSRAASGTERRAPPPPRAGTWRSYAGRESTGASGTSGPVKALLPAVTWQGALQAASIITRVQRSYEYGLNA